MNCFYLMDHIETDQKYLKKHSIPNIENEIAQIGSEAYLLVRSGDRNLQ